MPITLPLISLLLSLLMTIFINTALAQDSKQDIAAKKNIKTELSTQQASNILLLTKNMQRQGQFTQHKYFKVLKKPFVSKGTFSVNQQDFLWQTLKPAKSAIIFEQGMLYIEEAGVKKPMPHALGFSSIIRLLIAGDFNELADEFSFFTANVAQCITLLPKDSDVSKVINSLTLCGAGQADKITLLDAQHNKTDIMLSYTRQSSKNSAEDVAHSE